MKEIKIGLQIYGVREEFAHDPRATLKAIKAMGYDGVEFAGDTGLSGAALRAMLDETGLLCCGWHTSFAAVQSETLAATVALNRMVGNRFVIVPGGIPPEFIDTRAGWQKLAAFFSELADTLADEGMVTGYHNHWTEFTPLEGELPWDTLFQNSDERVVAQLDTGNALRGGADVVATLQRYPGRGVTVHLKPYKTVAAGGHPDDGFRPLIGDDDLPWGEIFETCRSSAGTEWYIVEYESDAYAPLVAADLLRKRLL